MRKNKIVLYTVNRTPLTLGHLNLHSSYYVEDIFDAVEDAEDFDDLTDKLQSILNEDLTVDHVTDTYIRYKITRGYGCIEYLKISIQL